MKDTRISSLLVYEGESLDVAYLPPDPSTVNHRFDWLDILSLCK